MYDKIETARVETLQLKEVSLEKQINQYQVELIRLQREKEENIKQMQIISNVQETFEPFIPISQHNKKICKYHILYVNIQCIYNI